MKDGKFTGQILLSLNNAIVKNELMSAVIQKNKKDGVALNIGEFLTKHNSNIFYQMRTLRKNHQGKIFSCFSRQGRIFYKLTKDAKPTLISGQADVDELASKLEKQVKNPSTTTKPQARKQNKGKQNHRVSHEPQRRSERNWRKLTTEDDDNEPREFNM